ncbi:nitroreductase family deazaflavin-dependent oxidoreductase [Nocardia puris]|uniref:nitroreductase/quinone reductase family protein n=1 Tax=Nocardia puris TaxID=208602 RepID=UPI0018942853|nr:nitroreductase/quinone reductase family protein [Nocardia puris]MBF6211049.1 nitroreductase family deazaflavin-dependent oxidoreductase [Nocardia puris]MBF6364645.1 nitroreductase family deazaflavin-dependent oxidoreductase [Nocardia puris]MBF6459574.1 nitroreductase family deazaflavin-dependent oxidoreductase [Nocardia puris]
MSESHSPAAESTITDYDDPNAPWNKLAEDGDVAGWNNDVISEFREQGGKVGGDYEGGDLVLLTTTGAKSGKQHVVPLGLCYRGEIPYVSSFVEDRYPAWYHNVKADGRVVIEHGSHTYDGFARVLTGAAYDEFAAFAFADNPMLAQCQERAGHPLPLVVLEFGEPRK